MTFSTSSDIFINFSSICISDICVKFTKLFNVSVISCTLARIIAVSSVSSFSGDAALGSLVSLSDFSFLASNFLTTLLLIKVVNEVVNFSTDYCCITCILSIIFEAIFSISIVTLVFGKFSNVEFTASIIESLTSANSFEVKLSLTSSRRLATRPRIALILVLAISFSYVSLLLYELKILLTIFSAKAFSFPDKPEKLAFGAIAFTLLSNASYEPLLFAILLLAIL